MVSEHVRRPLSVRRHRQATQPKISGHNRLCRESPNFVLDRRVGGSAPSAGRVGGLIRMREGALPDGRDASAAQGASRLARGLPRAAGQARNG